MLFCTLMLASSFCCCGFVSWLVIVVIAAGPGLASSPVSLGSGSSSSEGASAPRMLEDARDRDPLVDVAVQHTSDEVDVLFTENVGDAQVVVHDLVDAVERVLFVDDRVQEDAQRPYVLLFAAVGAAG